MEKLSSGMSGTAVSDLQHKLLELEFYQGQDDGFFGPKTRAAVVAFQKSRGLQQNGVVDDRTFGALGYLALGMNNSRVKELKENLKRYGYYDGNIDELFDAETQDSVIHFQADRGLEQNGVASPSVMQVLSNSVRSVRAAPTIRDTPDGAMLRSSDTSVNREHNGDHIPQKTHSRRYHLLKYILLAMLVVVAFLTIHNIGMDRCDNLSDKHPTDRYACCIQRTLKDENVKDAGTIAAEAKQKLSAGFSATRKTIKRYNLPKRITDEQIDKMIQNCYDLATLATIVPSFFEDQNDGTMVADARIPIEGRVLLQGKPVGQGNIGLVEFNRIQKASIGNDGSFQILSMPSHDGFYRFSINVVIDGTTCKTQHIVSVQSNDTRNIQINLQKSDLDCRPPADTVSHGRSTSENP